MAGTNRWAFAGLTVLRALALALFAAACLAPQRAAWAQTGAASELQPGRPGKDVVWLPTAQQLVDRMLDMAGATPNDYVVDLGSGDGRIVIAAARRGIRAMGIEYDPALVVASRQNAAQAGVADKTTFVEADIFKSDFSDATVLTLFLLPELNVRLRPIILNMKPGTRVVSNTFRMGDWPSDETVTADSASACEYWCAASLWIVPAKVAGQWKFGDGMLTLKQRYQVIEGTVEGGGQTRIIADAKLRGDQISFKVGGVNYSGKVSGDRMEGSMGTGDSSKPWSAARMQ